MIRKTITGAIVATLLGVSAIAVASETTAQPASPDFNPVNPATFVNFINPQTHKAYQDALLDPTQWAQFAQPQFYLQMANPQAMTQWMNPASYQALMNPNTYMYWMQPNVMIEKMTSVKPEVYMNPANYQKLMDPNTYMSWMNPATYTDASAQVIGAANGTNWFDISAWSNMFQPAPQVETEKTEKTEG